MKLLVENPNELIEERYYTEKDMLRIAGNLNQNAQHKYELEVGDILYFDKDLYKIVLFHLIVLLDIFQVILS